MTFLDGIKLKVVGALRPISSVLISLKVSSSIVAPYVKKVEAIFDALGFLCQTLCFSNLLASVFISGSRRGYIQESTFPYFPSFIKMSPFLSLFLRILPSFSFFIFIRLLRASYSIKFKSVFISESLHIQNQVKFSDLT